MGTHPIFESDFDCLTDMTIDISSLPIYDDESKKPPLVKQPEVVSIYDVAAKARYKIIDGPLKCAKAHIKKYANRSYEHLTSSTGMQQVASLTVGAFIGSKLALKYMPRLKGKKYSTAYVAGNRTLAYSVPWAVSCYWFETPAVITQYAYLGVKTTVSWTLWAIWQPFYWTGYFFFYAIPYAIWTILSFGASGISAAVSYAFSSKPIEQSEPVELVESDESAKDADVVKISEVEVLNETTAEAELKTLKRHENSESEIRLEQSGADSSLEPLEEDLGQAEAEDQDLYEKGRGRA